MTTTLEKDDIAFPSVPYHRGMTLLDYFAAKALQGLCAFATSEEGYTPRKKDSDFAPDPEGKWYKGEVYWFYSFEPPRKDTPHSGPHKLITTEKERLARHAYDIARAMIAERNKV